MTLAFFDEKVEEELLRGGEVFLVRREKREEGPDQIVSEPDGEKIADVDVKLEKKIPLNTYRNREVAFYNFLKTYSNASGFANTYEWVDRVKERYGKLPENLFLYKLKLEEEHLTATRWYELNRPEELPRSEADTKKVMKEILDRRGVPEEYRKYFQRLVDVDGWEGVDFLMADILLEQFPDEPMVELKRAGEGYMFQVKPGYKGKVREKMRGKHGRRREERGEEPKSEQVPLAYPSLGVQPSALYRIACLLTTIGIVFNFSFLLKKSLLTWWIFFLPGTSLIIFAFILLIVGLHDERKAKMGGGSNPTSGKGGESK